MIQYEGGTEAAGRTYVTGDPQGQLDAIAAESTSAALARVERERDELATAFDEADVARLNREVDLGRARREREEALDALHLARAELASARQELDALRTVRDQLGRDLAEARRIIAAYEGEIP